MGEDPCYVSPARCVLDGSLCRVHGDHSLCSTPGDLQAGPHDQSCGTVQLHVTTAGLAAGAQHALVLQGAQPSHRCHQVFQLAQVLGALQASISESDAIITHDPLPTLQGDATRLGQVLQNLIGNALRFRGDTPPRIHLTAVKEGPRWQFSVRDNGTGIDPQQVGKLFQVFQRAHGREYAGTGIGLAICKRIVEQHGGRIWVESTPGAGSVFYFIISDIKEKEKRSTDLAPP